MLELLINDVSRLMTRCRATELSVAAGLLVTTRCGDAINVVVTLMCRRRLLESLRGHPPSILLGSLIPVNTVPIWLNCLLWARLQRKCSGSVIRRVMATIGPNVVEGPRNITFIQWLCRLVTVRLDVLMTLALFTLTSLEIRVESGNKFTTDPVTTDPLELDELTKFMCLLLVTPTLILRITGTLPTMTPRPWTSMSTCAFLT